MAGFQLNNKIETHELQRGDHIYCYRFMYSHHGIYVGDNRVIHYVGNKSGSRGSWCSECEILRLAGAAENGVVCTCLECFSKGKELRLFRYGVNRSTYEFSLGGTCSVLQANDPDEVIAKADALLRLGFGDYNLLKHNCEIFCVHCKTDSISLLTHFGPALDGPAIDFSARSGGIPLPAKSGGLPLHVHSALDGIFVNFVCTHCGRPVHPGVPDWHPRMRLIEPRDGMLYLNDQVLLCPICKHPIAFAARSRQLGMSMGLFGGAVCAIM